MQVDAPVLQLVDALRGFSMCSDVPHYSLSQSVYVSSDAAMLETENANEATSFSLKQGVVGGIRSVTSLNAGDSLRTPVGLPFVSRSMVLAAGPVDDRVPESREAFGEITACFDKHLGH
jgi:hypothetical protein